MMASETADNVNGCLLFWFANRKTYTYGKNVFLFAVSVFLQLQLKNKAQHKVKAPNEDSPLGSDEDIETNESVLTEIDDEIRKCCERNSTRGSSPHDR